MENKYNTILVEEKNKAEEEFKDILIKIKNFFDKYKIAEDELNEEDIGKIYNSLSSEEMDIYIKLQSEFEMVIKKLKELDEIKINEDSIVSDNEEEDIEADITKEEEVSKKYEMVETLKNTQVKFLCLLETTNKLYPERFKLDSIKC